MADFEFDGDADDTEEYYLVAEEGSVDADGYGKFVDSFHGHHAYHQHYKQAQRYYSEWEASRVRDETEICNGTPCVVIAIAH